jgi:hypothetical protein
MSTRNANLRRLHAAAREARLSDEAYRDRLEREFGVRSAKQLDDAQLERAAKMFPVKQNANFPHTRLPKALWIALANLGAADRTDAALDAFVLRQTGKARLAFLTPADANTVTEALKAMCAREGFAFEDKARDGLAPRHALLEAQWKKLAAIGAVKIADKDALHRWLDKRFSVCFGGYQQLSKSQLDGASAALGRWIRATLAKKRAAA